MKVIGCIFINIFITFGSLAGVSEAGLLLGCSYYLGDLNPNRHFLMLKPAAGIVHRYVINPHFSFRNSFYYGGVAADDAKAANLTQSYRNLNFKSKLIDVSSLIEFNFLPFQEKIKTYSSLYEAYHFFSPYIFTGISVFSFNPQAEIKGKLYDLHPLGTEGQGTIAYPDKKKYSLTQISLPMGAGIKLEINKNMILAFEWGFRMTFTDYLDDVSTTYPDPVVLSAENGEAASTLSDRSSANSETSGSNTGRQRGNSSDKDWYSFAGVIITYKIRSKLKEQKCQVVGGAD